MQAFWVPGRPFSTKIRPYKPKKGLNFWLGFVALSADVFMASPRRHREDTLCVFPVSSPRIQTEATLEAKCYGVFDFDGNQSQHEAKKDQKDVLKPKWSQIFYNGLPQFISYGSESLDFCGPLYFPIRGILKEWLFRRPLLNVHFSAH